MEKIKKLNLDDLVKKNIGKAAKAAFVCHTVNKVLKEVFKKDFLKEIKIVSFKEGSLYISADGPYYLQEIKIKESEIIKKANSALGKDLVEKIKFKTQKPQ